jgi:hypothetical protein
MGEGKTAEPGGATLMAGLDAIDDVRKSMS